LGALALAVAQIALTIQAALKAHQGEYYRYPLSIAFLTLPAEEPLTEIVEPQQVP
jgi:hypothetical protein